MRPALVPKRVTFGEPNHGNANFRVRGGDRGPGAGTRRGFDFLTAWHDIIAMLGSIRMVAEKVIAEEQAFSRTVRETGTAGPKGIVVDAEVQNAIRAHRKRVLDIVERMPQVHA
jgi:hypothetical protein